MGVCPLFFLVGIESKLENYNTKSYSLYMRKLCTKWFKKWAKKANLSNLNLLKSRQVTDSIEKQILFNLEVVE